MKVAVGVIVGASSVPRPGIMPASNCNMSAASSESKTPSPLTSDLSWHGNESIRPAANCKSNAASRAFTLPSQFTSPSSAASAVDGALTLPPTMTAVSNSATNPKSNTASRIEARLGSTRL